MNGYTLITGATSGIGYALAKIFAEHGYNLVIVGRNEKKLARVKAELEQATNIASICADFASPNSAKLVYDTLMRLEIQVEHLINNAGAGYVGDFVEASDERILELISLNMTQLTLLTKWIAKDMKERKHGRIMNVASTGAYHPGPYTAVYYATKAYVLSLSEALYEELKPYHVYVSALCPGATKTHFAKAAGRENTKIAMSPEYVAKKAYKGFIRGKRLIIPGLQNRLFIKLPRKIAAQFIRNYQLNLLKK